MESEIAAEQQVVRDMRGSGVTLRKIAGAVSERGFRLSYEVLKQIVQARLAAA